MGRRAGTDGHERAAAYIAAEAATIGLLPAGEHGTFFQAVPLERREVDARSTLSIDGRSLALWRDYAPILARGGTRALDGARVIYGGTVGDGGIGITPAEAAGRIVLLGSPPGATSLTARSYPAEHPLAGAAAVVLTGIDASYVNIARRMSEILVAAPPADLQDADPPALAAHIGVPTRVATLLLGAAIENARPGQLGRTVYGRLSLTVTPVTSQNVIALLPGDDPALRSQYVALSAHSDHLGYTQLPIDHDSAHVQRSEVRRAQVATGGPLSTSQRASAAMAIDSIRRLRPIRADSIYNGADDNASGSVALLAIAESFARAPRRPARSLLFIWHTAEEIGLVGARWLTDHPVVPLDSLVALLNVDMLGRGGAGEESGGGPAYLQLIGARRLSPELGALIEAANQAQPIPFQFDYTFDAPGHPQRMYCRSDHAMYARFGIPVAYFTTGQHGDYHQLTDEAQYIDYEKLSAATRLIGEVARRLGNLDHRLVVSAATPDPAAPCTQ
jgi:putative aminopeptidase FrvX